MSIVILKLSSGEQVIGQWVENNEECTCVILHHPRTIIVSPDFTRAVCVPYYLATDAYVHFHVRDVQAMGEEIPEGLKHAYLQQVSGLQIASSLPRSSQQGRN